MNLRTAFVCCCCILFVSAASADQNDPRLDDLFLRLKNATSMAEAAPIETVIWQIWTEHDNAGFNNQMLIGIQQMSRNALPAALATFNQLVEEAPDFAEAWNKRATIYYLMGNYPASEADIVKTLQLEPFHFGALSGRGQVLLAQNRFEAARNAFSTALEVNPNLPGAKASIEAINNYLRGTAI